MRRALLGAALLAALVGIAVLKRGPVGGQRTTSGAEDAQKERIRVFWDRYHAATAARTRGDFRGAAERYRQGLELSPQHEDSIFYLAVSLQELGRYAEAASLLRRLTEINPASNRAFSQLGVLLTTLAPGATPDFDAAAAAFARNKEINIEESGPFLRQGLLHLNRGRLGEARAAFALASGAGAPEALYLAGLVDYVEGRYASAAGGFLRVLEANEREKAISGRGVFSEGDVASDPAEQKLNAFERAGIKALLFLYWTAARLGGYPKTVEERFRIHAGTQTKRRFRAEPLPGDASGRGTWLDYDRDGRPDLLVTRAGGVTLFRNTEGGFADVTRAAGLAGITDAWDACAFGQDRSRGPDLHLVRKGHMGTGANVFLRNEGGHFRDVTAERGLAGDRATARAIAADLSGDGRVDLLEVGPAGPGWGAVRLFVNEGFRLAERTGVLGLADEAAAVDAVAGDFDEDGRTDVFVLSWKSPGRLFRQTAGGFEDMTAAAGLQGVGGEGLSALALDYDRDGHLDLLVTARAAHELSLLRILSPSLRSTRQTPRLFRGLGGGRFQEVTKAIGLDRPFGVMEAVSADFDGDGWPDLAFAQGGFERERLEPSLVLRNEEGHGFSPWAYLPEFDRPVNALGLAVTDADGDGRPDLFLSGVGVLLNREK